MTARMLDSRTPSLRIAFLDSWLQQTVEGSGTAAAIGGLGQGLVQRGHRVTRISPTSGWPPSLTLRRLLFNIYLPALLRSLTYDLIVGVDIDGCLWAGRDNHTPYVCAVKGVIAEESTYERGAVRWQLWSLSRLERLNVRRAPLVITDTDYCRRMVCQHYGIPVERVKLVPAGIALERWRKVLDSASVQRAPCTILCVARQYPRKRVADLLQAFVQVRQHMPRARLVIIGAGPEHDQLRMLARQLCIEDSTHFLGGVPDDNEVVMWYKRSTIFCLPSIQECMGIVFLEAMASGLPIVTTTAAAMPEVVPQRQAGILVPPMNPSAIATALIELLEQPEVRATYGAFGQAYVQQYDWEIITDQFLRMIYECI